MGTQTFATSGCPVFEFAKDYANAAIIPINQNIPINKNIELMIIPAVASPLPLSPVFLIWLYPIILNIKPSKGAMKLIMNPTIAHTLVVFSIFVLQ